jgi:hypothetical protein
MPSESVQHVTELLRAAQAGDAAAADQLLAAVYEQLHQLARARMARNRSRVEGDRGTRSGIVSGRGQGRCHIKASGRKKSPPLPLR